MNDVYLSFSGQKTYLTCPRRYKLIYIDKKFEVTDKKSALFGIVIGKVFEWFYERKFWAEKDAVQHSLNSIQTALDYTIAKENIQVDSDFLDKLMVDLKHYVICGVKTIKDNKLLSSNSRAEVKLDVIHKADNLEIKLGGRADFIHIDSNLITILDGKGSKWRDKYADPDQLIWYATQFYLKYHVAPSRLGFVFWMFPDNPIQWIAYDNNSIRMSLKRTVDIIKSILNQKFDPAPGSYCKLCGYSSQCEDGASYIEARKMMKSEVIQSSVFGIETI